MKTGISNSTTTTQQEASRRACGSWLQRSIRMVILTVSTLALLLSPPALRRGYCQEVGILLAPDNTHRGGVELSYDELVDLLNQYLGEAQQVNLYVDACYSGALQWSAGSLRMPYFVATSQGASKCAVEGSSKTDVNPPGRLTISPIGQDPNFYYGFSEYITKELRNAANCNQLPTLLSLYNSAVSDIKEDPDMKSQFPDWSSGNGADPGISIEGGRFSNHALIFDGNISGLYVEPDLELYRVLASPAYSFQKPGNSLNFYFHTYPAQNFQGARIDGPGTLANLKIALQNLQKQIAGGGEMVNIFIDAHGYNHIRLR